VKALDSAKGATFFTITLPILADLAAAQQAGLRHPLFARTNERVDA
jgi:hypothetical protein